jgi:peptidoglycan hydrolase-like protein with peptidoglycan-binding domain
LIATSQHAFGLYQGNVDGRIGPATRDAVHAYQIKVGLKPADSLHAGFGAEAAEWAAL